jgi:hypothetical protein
VYLGQRGAAIRKCSENEGQEKTHVDGREEKESPQGAKCPAGVAGGNGLSAHDLLLVIYGRAPGGLSREEYSLTTR